MAHETLEPIGHGKYYAGDALDIKLTVMNERGAKPKDITDADIDFHLKEDTTQADTDALLTKSTSEPDEIEITSATDGKATIKIATDDTLDVLEDGTETLESREFYWNIQVTDTDGRRITVQTGNWTIHSG